MKAFIKAFVSKEEWLTTFVISAMVFMFLYMIFKIGLGRDYEPYNFLWCLFGGRIGFALAAMRNYKTE